MVSPMPLSGRPWPVTVAVKSAVDILAVIVGYLLATTAVSPYAPWGSRAHFPLLIVATVAIWPLVYAVFGLYDVRRHSDVQRVVNAGLTAALFVLMVLFFARVDVSRDYFAALLVFSLVSVVVARLVTRPSEMSSSGR
jgi:FlaA1/EpsC-like NDP-sugar epimerase